MFMNEINDDIEISLPFSLPTDELGELNNFIIGNENETLQDTMLTQYVPNFNLDDTMDVQLKYNPEEEFIPISPRGPPERENMSGKYNFVVEISSKSTQRKTFLYSHRLNRIYVKMGYKFSVNFNWDASKVTERNLYIRATTVFSDLAEAQKRVERCLQHSHESANVGIVNQPHLVNNILRSARGCGPDVSGVYYCGRADYEDSWYSVLVAFTTPETHAYQFLCSNSCSSGINRRAIEIIFTLEDRTGLVLGRQNVGTRVCSCPRRDVSRDEKEKPKKTKRPIVAAEPPPVPTKRVLQDAGDHQPATVTLPAVEVIGARTAIAGYRVMLDIMETMKADKTLSQQSLEDINKKINNIKNIIESIKNEHRVNT